MPHFLHLPLPGSLSLALPDSFATALSELVLVIEDMLTSVDRYRLPNCNICLVAVCTHAFCVYGYLLVHICRGLSKMFATQARCTPRLLSFNSACPWGCQLSLLGHVRVFTCVYMMDFAISLWRIIRAASIAIFLPWIFYHRINKRQFSRLLFTQGQTGGAQRSCGSLSAELSSAEIIGGD